VLAGAKPSPEDEVAGVNEVDVGRGCNVLVLVLPMVVLVIGDFKCDAIGTFDGDGTDVLVLSPAFSEIFKESKLNKPFFAHGSSCLGTCGSCGGASPCCACCLSKGLKSPLPGSED
jgi:hypothetical protein